MRHALAASMMGTRATADVTLPLVGRNNLLPAALGTIRAPQHGG
jgi:hypothetical protein